MMQFDQALLPSQYDFVMDRTSRFLGFSGGYGSGKSQAAQVRTLRLMLQDPKANILYGMPSYDLLQIRIVPEFMKLLEQYGIQYNYTKQSKTFDLEQSGMGKIYLRSFDRPESYVSFSVSAIVLDELDLLPFAKADSIFKKALSRLRQPSSTDQVNSLSVVSTPDMGLHGSMFHRFVDKPAPHTRLIYGSTKKNFFNPPEYVQNLYDTYDDPELVSMYLEGKFVSLNKVKQFSRYDIATNSTDRTITPDDYLYIALDFNYGACVFVIGIKEGDTMHLVDEGYAKDTMAFVEYWTDCENKFTVCPDATGKNMSTNSDRSNIQIIKDGGFKVKHQASNPRVSASLIQCNNHLYKKRILVNRQSCPQLSKALDTIGFDERGQPEKFNRHPSYDDYGDAFRYLIFAKMPLVAKTKIAQMRRYT